MIIDLNITNATDTEKIILNVKTDNVVMVHKNIDNVKDIKEELLKIIGELEWMEEHI